MESLCAEETTVARDWVTNVEAEAGVLLSSSHDGNIRLHCQGCAPRVVGTTRRGALCCTGLRAMGGSFAVAGDEEGTVSLFAIEASGKTLGTELATARFDRIAAIKAIRTSATSADIVAAAGKTLVVLHITTSAASTSGYSITTSLCIQREFCSPVNRLSPHASGVIAGGDDMTLKYFDLDSCKGNVSVKTRRSFKGLTASITSLCVCSSAGREILCAGCYDGSIRLWSLAYGTLLICVKVPCLPGAPSSPRLHSPVTSIAAAPGDWKAICLTLRSGVVASLQLECPSACETLFKPSSLSVGRSAFYSLDRGDNEILDASFDHSSSSVHLACKDGVVVKASTASMFGTDDGCAVASPEPACSLAPGLCSPEQAVPARGGSCPACGRGAVEGGGSPAGGGEGVRHAGDVSSDVSSALQRQSTALEAAFTCKLDALHNEKAAAVDENKRLLAVIKRLTLENERLKCGVPLRQIPVSPVHSSDEASQGSGTTPRSPLSDPSN